MKAIFPLMLVAGCFGVVTAYGQQTMPTDADIDRAIHACSIGTKTDAEIESGLTLLKKRILSSEGKITYSEIPSVIGGSVQTDEAKVRLFEKIQECVVQKVYPTKSSDNLPPCAPHTSLCITPQQGGVVQNVHIDGWYVGCDYQRILEMGGSGEIKQFYMKNAVDRCPNR